MVRSGWSLSPFDFVPFGRRGVLLVQVKINRCSGHAEYARLIRFDNPPQGASKQVWI